MFDIMAVLSVWIPVLFWVIYGIVGNWLNPSEPKSWGKFDHF